jgi:hypothetical protein
MVNVAKVLEEDQVTGSKLFKYRRTGPDDFAHATAYALLAARRVGVSSTYNETYDQGVKAQIDFDRHTYDQDNQVEF